MFTYDIGNTVVPLHMCGWYNYICIHVYVLFYGNFMRAYMHTYIYTHTQKDTHKKTHITYAYVQCTNQNKTPKQSDTHTPHTSHTHMAHMAHTHTCHTPHVSHTCIHMPTRATRDT